MLDLELGFSRTLTALLGLAHLLSLLLIWVMPLGLGLELFSACLVVASCAFHLWRDCFRRAPGAIVRLRVDMQGHYSYQIQNGAWHEAHLLPTSFVTPWLSVLNFRPEGSRRIRHAVLFPDALDPEAYRKLRVRLKWGNNTPEN